MSEHSIEELELQWKQADAYAGEAKKRFWDAKFEATGFKGCVAEVTKNGKTTRFLPIKSCPWHYIDEIEGPIIKKDGLLSARRIRAYTHDCINLGLYTPPA